MLRQLQSWKGAIEIDGTLYDSIQSIDSIENANRIILYSSNKNVVERKITQIMSTSQEYIITVKQYMTRQATPEFDFMAKWNNNIPMPLRTMVGTIEKETPGMLYMKLHGDIITEQTQHCMKCGKIITNPVSQFFGMGPECGKHNYVNPFESDEELKLVVDNYRRNYLQKITWEGWIIRSSIIKKEEVKNEI